MNKERFYTGYTFHEYLDKMDPANRDGFLASYRAAALSESQIAEVRALDQITYVLAVTESWCGDCRINVPLLARLVEAAPWLVLRCHSRDSSQDLNILRIPTFIFYDESFKELGRWIERPSTVARVLSEGTDDEKREIRRRYNAGEFHAETFNEIVSILRK